MKNLTRRIAASIKEFLKGHHQRLKKRAFASDFFHTFRQLECRRVLSVTGVFDNGTGLLSVTIAAGGNTNGALLVDGNEFYVDENGNLSRDGGDESGLLTDLKQIQVNSAPGVGTFAWRGDFSTSNLLQSLLVQNVSSTSIGATASLLGNLSVSSATSIIFEPTAAVNVGGTANLSGGSIQFSAGSSLDATSSITLQANGLNSDIQIDGSIHTTNGSIDMTAPDSILFGPAGSLDAENNGNVTLTANSDALNGNGIDGIQMGDGSSIHVANGTIRLSALNAFAGDITLGELVADTNAGTAIEIRSAGNIVDGTALDTNLAADANLQASLGTILLQSNGGSIGAGVAASDIDINSQGLVFNSPGIVQITDVTGGVRVNDASSALGGGFLAANSPLTISANVNVGASMIFTAGDSFNPSDDLTIDSGAIVTLTSAASGVLTFNAGDSIRFNSGRIVTTGGGTHSVQLVADLDNAGVGAADGDRGVILGDGTAIVEVSTDNLTANAANGIDIDTTITTLTASNTVTGGITVRETDGIVLTSVTSTSGSVDVTAAGLITATSVAANIAGDVTLVSTNGDVGVGLVQANAGNVTINAQNNILDTDPLPDSLVFDIVANDITLTATTGNIGATSPDIFREQVNPLEISAAGNYTATALLGMIAINLDATNAVAIATITNTLWYQSNGDINVAGLTLANNLALIADADNDGAGTLFLGNSLAVPGDLRVEGADISAADGSIDLSANRMMVYSGQTEILFVDTNQLDATTNGDLSVFANNSIELIDLAAPFQVDHNPVTPPIDRDNIALQTLGNGFLLVQANGSITVSDDVIAGNDAIQTSAGSVTLQALAVNGNVIINDTILSDRGDIVIEANQDILVDGAIGATEALDTDNLALVTSTTGNITLRADLDASSNGAITMADGTRVIAGRDTSALYDPGLNGNPSPTAFSLGAGAQLAGFAEIRLFAFGAIALGSLQSENVDTASISVQSINGSITDNTAAETSNLITSGTATLSAAQGIGAAGAADIDTTIGTLVATNSTSGDIFVQETNGLVIGGTGVRTLAGDGNINIDVDAGNLTVSSVVTASGAGTITLNADTGTIAMSASVSSTSGSISITGDAVNQNAGGNIATGGAGTVSVTADNGSIVMADGTTTTTANSAINYSATLNVAISRLSSTDATINVTADSDLNLTGAITDSSAAETPNLITTGTAVLVAAQGIGAAGAADIDTTIGTLVATNSTSGSIFVQETDGLIIAGTGVRTLGGSGNINVDVDAGNLTVNSVVTADGSGTVTLNADAGTIDLNAVVSSTSGAIAVTGDIVNQNAGGNISTGGSGTATVIADNGNITMADGTTTTTINGAINYTATGNVLLSQLISTNGSIDVTADSDSNGTGSITDNTAAETSNLITTGTATLSAAQGIGAAGAADIDTTIGTLVATNTTNGDIFVQETNGLVIGGTGVRTLAGNGNIVIDVLSGNLTVSSLVTANGAGNILLQTPAADGDIVVNATVQSGSGHISLLAGDDIALNSNVSTGGTGTVYLLAANGTVDLTSGVDMASGANVTTAGGNVRILAQNNGDIRLGRIDVVSGNVSLIASQSILDANGASLNVTAINLRMVATNGTIGGSDLLNGTPDVNVNAIDTQVAILAASSATGIYIREEDGLAVDNTVAIGVQQVNVDASTTAVSDTSLEDLATSLDGPIKLQSSLGNIVINSGSLVPFGIQANGPGDVLLQTLAANGDVIINGVVRSGTGHISLVSGDDVNLSANIVTGGAGSVFLSANNATADAQNGVDMVAGASLFTGGGNVRVVSGNNGDIRLGVVNVGAGSVSLAASGSILDGNGAATNVIANALRMVATNGSIGEADPLNGMPDVNVRAIDTQVAILAASSATGIHVLEADGVTIDTTGAISVQKVNFNSTETAVVDASAEDLTTSNNGSIKLLSLAGNIVVDSGTGASLGVQANGTGDVLLQTQAANGDIVINGGVQSQAGHITMRSGDDLDLNANISTAGAGTFYLLASNTTADAINGIDMASGTSVTTMGGNVRIAAQNGGDVRLGLVDAGNGSVSIRVSGSVLDSNGDSLNIAASNLRIQSASGTVGTAIDAIETRVSVIAASSVSGIFVFEANGVRVDETGSVSVEQANFNSTRETVTDTSLEDLVTTNGTIHLRSAIGDIVIHSGSETSFGVNALGAGSDVILQVEATVGPQSGNVALDTLVRSADDVTLISRGGWIDDGGEAASVQGDLLTIEAAQYAHLHNTQVNQLAASTGRNQTLIDSAGQLINMNASNSGDDFLSNLSTGITTPVSLSGGANPSNFLFADKYSAAGYSLYIVNGRSLVVNNLSAGTTSLNVSPNIYIETQGASNLVVSGAVVTQSSTNDEGGIVLVAGDKFTLNPSGRLETHTVVPAAAQFIEQIGPIAGSLTPVSYVDAQFFDGGEGSDPDMRSTKFVLHQFASASETPLRHVNQRVAIQFGFAGESGFVTLIGYADGGQPRVFDTFGEQGILPLDSVNPAAINSFPNSAAPNAIFTRPEPFNDAFLTSNSVLLTNVVVRRSSDFFVFENAAEIGGSPVKDLTFEYKQIKAFTEGDNSAVELPAAPPPLQVLIPGIFVLPAVIQNSISIRPPEIEFAEFVDKPSQVLIYPITYQDLNRDGQPDLNELPLENEVLESLRKIKPIDEIVSPDGGSPTPQQIDTKKAELLRDPQLPSGAYAIVEKDADGKEVVIDVFPVRDWEEENSETTKEMPFIPNKEEPNQKKDAPPEELVIPRPIPKDKDSEAMFVPAIQRNDDVAESSDDSALAPSTSRSRFASVGMMFGSMWVLREATKSEATPTDQAIQELGSVGYSRSERRNRRTGRGSFYLS